MGSLGTGQRIVNVSLDQSTHVCTLRSIFLAADTLAYRIAAINSTSATLGPHFIAEEFCRFMTSNGHGVKHICSSPHHPVTNGAAERLVLTVKQTLRDNHREVNTVGEIIVFSSPTFGDNKCKHVQSSRPA